MAKNGRGSNFPAEVLKAMTTWAMMLAEWKWTLRGVNTRSAMVVELQSVDAPSGNIDDYWDWDWMNGDLCNLDLTDPKDRAGRILGLIVRASKRNLEAKVEQSGCLRHRDPMLCNIGNLAMMLLYRWDVLHLRHPDFRNTDWYEIPLFVDFNDKILDRGSHSSHEKELQNKAKVYRQKITHLGRKAVATLQGIVDKESIQQHGNWNRDSCGVHYLCPFPPDVLLVHAGFTKDGIHFLGRDQVLPPASLESQIFPWVDDALHKAERVQADIAERQANGQEVTVAFLAAFNYDHSSACYNVLKTLKWFKSVILQDSVFFRQFFPEHPVFTHPVFSDPLYIEWEAAVREAQQQSKETNPNAKIISNVAPALGAQMSSFSRQQQAVLRETKQHNAKLDDMSEMVGENSRKLDAVMDLLQRQTDNAPAGIHVSMVNSRGETLLTSSTVRGCSKRSISEVSGSDDEESEGAEAGCDDHRRIPTSTSSAPSRKRSAVAPPASNRPSSIAASNLSSNDHRTTSINNTRAGPAATMHAHPSLEGFKGSETPFLIPTITSFQQLHRALFKGDKEFQSPNTTYPQEPLFQFYKKVKGYRMAGSKSVATDAKHKQRFLSLINLLLEVAGIIEDHVPTERRDSDCTKKMAATLLDAHRTDNNMIGMYHYQEGKVFPERLNQIIVAINTKYTPSPEIPPLSMTNPSYSFLTYQGKKDSRSRV